jgi:hypothetical protein
VAATGIPEARSRRSSVIPTPSRFWIMYQWTALVSTLYAATAIRAFRSGSGGLLSALAKLFGRH